jgi:hypothetical protein
MSNGQQHKEPDMRIVSRFVALGMVCLAGIVAVAWSTQPLSLHAQDKSKTAKKPSKPVRTKPLANTRGLDMQAEKIQSSFARDAEELAGQYVEAGHLDKAKSLLESALVVNPDSPNIQKKLEQVKEGILNSNDFEIDVSPAQGWKPSGAVVVENRPLRIRTEGTYRFELATGGVSASGFPEKDPETDLIAGIPCGALMGTIIDSQGKSNKPFLIGESVEFTPKSGGMLLLRVNAPAGNKNSGKIKVIISGYIQAK